jgi:hypothetical protein
MTKIFQIGFNKCGTRSISHFFKRHGLETADWNRGDLAKSIKSDLETGEIPLQAWPDVEVFSDLEYVNAKNMIEGYRYFDQLHQHYPDALFILNTRNGEGWIRSRHAHGDGAYTDAYRRHYGYDTVEQVTDRWRLEWYRHHAQVLEFFSGERSKNLFVWNIENPAVESLQKKLPFQLKTHLWTQRGKS